MTRRLIAKMHETGDVWSEDARNASLPGTDPEIHVFSVQKNLWVEGSQCPKKVSATDDAGGHLHLTLGAAIRASKSTQKAVPTFFV